MRQLRCGFGESPHTRSPSRRVSRGNRRREVLVSEREGRVLAEDRSLKIEDGPVDLGTEHKSARAAARGARDKPDRTPL